MTWRSFDVLRMGLALLAMISGSWLLVATVGEVPWWLSTVTGLQVAVLAAVFGYNGRRWERHLTALATRVDRGAFVELLPTHVDANGIEWEHDCDRCTTVAAFTVGKARVCHRCLGPEIYDQAQPTGQ